MAPQIEATYRRIEQRIGEHLSERFQQSLDELLAMLPEHESGQAAGDHLLQSKDGGAVASIADAGAIRTTAGGGGAMSVTSRDWY